MSITLSKNDPIMDAMFQVDSVRDSLQSLVEHDPAKCSDIDKISDADLESMFRDGLRQVLGQAEYDRDQVMAEDGEIFWSVHDDVLDLILDGKTHVD